MDLTFSQSRFSKVDRDTHSINVQDFVLFAVMPKLRTIQRHQVQRHPFPKETTSFPGMPLYYLDFIVTFIQEVEHHSESLLVTINVTVGANSPEHQ